MSLRSYWAINLLEYTQRLLLTELTHCGVKLRLLGKSTENSKYIWTGKTIESLRKSSFRKHFFSPQSFTFRGFFTRPSFVSLSKLIKGASQRALINAHLNIPTFFLKKLALLPSKKIVLCFEADIRRDKPWLSANRIDKSVHQLEGYYAMYLTLLQGPGVSLLMAFPRELMASRWEMSIEIFSLRAWPNWIERASRNFGSSYYPKINVVRVSLPEENDSIWTKKETEKMSSQAWRTPFHQSPVTPLAKKTRLLKQAAPFPTPILAILDFAPFSFCCLLEGPEGGLKDFATIEAVTL